MTAFVEVDDLLRGQGRYGPEPGGQETGPIPWRPLVAIGLAGGLLYGAVMGSYGLKAGQALYSALKVPLLVGVSTLTCLPNLYTMNAVLGLGPDFRLVIRAILLAQGTVAVALAALAPLTAFLYLGIADYATAVAANGFAFLIAALAGQVTLSRCYRPLVSRNPRHRIGRAAWLTLYLFVGIQAAWVLRPFVGSPDLPTRFFRAEAWGNAYVEVATLVWRVLVGR